MGEISTSVELLHGLDFSQPASLLRGIRVVGDLSQVHCPDRWLKGVHVMRQS